MYQVQKALHDTRSEVCGHTSDLRPDKDAIRLLQGQRYAYLIDLAAQVGYDCGPGREVCRGRSPGQGMYSGT